MDDEVSSGIAIFYYTNEGLPYTLSGKLKHYCPSFFSSLTLWEKEALENSGWLMRATTDSKGVIKGIQVGVEPGKVTLSSSGVEGRFPSVDIACVMNSDTIVPPSFSAWAPGISVDQVRESMDLRELASPSLPVFVESGVELRYRESKEDDHSLNLVMESMIPFIKDNDDAITLPTFVGRKCIDTAESSEAAISKLKIERQGREFAWSRGIGTEISPIKTRSCQNLLTQNSVKIIETTPSTSDIGPLRELKALVSAK